MLQNKCQFESYYSSSEMTIESLREFVDPLLCKTIGWLTNEHLFTHAADSDDHLQCLNIACDITTLATSVMSPKHLGLAVHLHHEFGSRKLVEHVSCLGYCVSYTELRHFLTSAAIHVGSMQEPTELGLISHQKCTIWHLYLRIVVGSPR